MVSFELMPLKSHVTPCIVSRAHTIVILNLRNISYRVPNASAQPNHHKQSSNMPSHPKTEIKRIRIPS